MDSWGCVVLQETVGDVSVEDLDGVLENGHFWPLDKKVPFLAVFLDVNSRGSTWLLDGGNFVATFHFFVATKFPASRFFKKMDSTKKYVSRQNLRRREFSKKWTRQKSTRRDKIYGVDPFLVLICTFPHNPPTSVLHRSYLGWG